MHPLLSRRLLRRPESPMLGKAFPPVKFPVEIQRAERVYNPLLSETSKAGDPSPNQPRAFVKIFPALAQGWEKVDDTCSVRVVKRIYHCEGRSKIYYQDACSVLESPAQAFWMWVWQELHPH
jgi:hypothetical protein